MIRVLSLLVLPVSLVKADLEFGRPFGSHMVLPMDRAVPVFGKASPRAEITVEFAGHREKATADAGGLWRVVLPAMPAAGDGRVLKARSGESSADLEDVLVGEVWLCAGQSNMDFPLGRAVGGRAEAEAASGFPAIRLMNLSGTHTAARRYQEDEIGRMDPARFFEGSWHAASADSAAAFSAVGWWAGKVIHRKTGVPVGLIDCSVGGSGAEAWLPRETLKSRADYAELLDPGWMKSPRVSAWARNRAAMNLDGRGADHPFRPGFLFDAGVRDWRGFPLSGVLWYQGETNAEINDDEWNERLITDLVTGWRKELEQPELPFLMVQLPRIGGNDPLRQWWPRFREVQSRAAAKLNGVDLIVTRDLGWDSPDVHQPDKRPVGERLGEAALRFRKDVR